MRARVARAGPAAAVAGSRAKVRERAYGWIEGLVPAETEEYKNDGSELLFF